MLLFEVIEEMEYLKKIDGKKLLILLILIGMTLVIAIQSPNDIFAMKEIPGTDSSVFQYMGWMMKEGYVPYRDFFDHKGILLYVINFIGVMISFDYGVWFLELITIFVSIYICYKIAEKRCGMLFGAGVTILIFSLMNLYYDRGNLTEEYAIPFQLAALAIFLDYFLEGKVSKLRLMICGICFGAVCLLRINMVSLWLVFCIMVLIQSIYQKKVKEIPGFLGFFLLGCGIFVLPFAIYLLYHHALDDFFEQYIVFNQMYASDENFVTTQGQIGALVFFGVTLAFGAAFVYLLLLLAKKERRFFHIGFLCYMVVTLLLICMSGQQYRHYGMTLLPALVYPYSLMAERFLSSEGKKKTVYGIAAGVLFIGIACNNWYMLALNVYQEVVQKNIYIDKQIQAVTVYVEENTTEEDEISVYGNRNMVYNLSGRKSASKYSYQKPIGAICPEIMEEYFAELEEKKPELIVVIEMDDNMKKFLKENNYKYAITFDYHKIYKYKG